MTVRPSAKMLLTVLTTVMVAALLVVTVLVVVSNERSKAGNKPNIVFVLTDDLDSGLLRYMPGVQKLKADGVSLSNYTVSNSLCCPSRASIFTGQFPHNTGVHTNDPPDGGVETFTKNGLAKQTFATTMQDAGYRTAMMGKYLNNYEPARMPGPGGSYVPPGWDEWAGVGTDGYDGFDYTMNQNGRLVQYGSHRSDYMTDVLSDRGDAFIRDSVESGDPFLLEISTFAPHGPFTPAPRHEDEFRGLKAPRTGSYGEPDVADKPAWLRELPRISGVEAARIDKDYRKRARSVQAVDEMLERLRRTLAETGQTDNTFVVFTSDNGFHLGQHRLLTGKKTAFDTDIHLPLVVAGPGVPAGKSVPQVAENIDLNPTFTDIGGETNTRADGRSLLPLLKGRQVDGWKNTALIEHWGPNDNRSDPDYQTRRDANPPSYTALRTASTTYVEYVTGEHEFYDRRRDPHELQNTYHSLPTAKRRSLHRQLEALRECKGAPSCSTAAGGGD